MNNKSNKRLRLNRATIRTIALDRVVGGASYNSPGEPWTGKITQCDWSCVYSVMRLCG
jgi:hypothetical protein